MNNKVEAVALSGDRDMMVFLSNLLSDHGITGKELEILNRDKVFLFKSGIASCRNSFFRSKFHEMDENKRESYDLPKDWNQAIDWILSVK